MSFNENEDEEFLYTEFDFINSNVISTKSTLQLQLLP